MSVKLRHFSDFVLSNTFKAMAVACGLVCVPVLGAISIVLAAFITLRQGAMRGLGVTIAATIPYLILLQTRSTSLLLKLIAIALIITSNLCTWLFALLYKRWKSWSRLLEVLALTGVIAVVSVHIVVPDIGKFWEQEMTTNLTNLYVMSNSDSLENVIEKMQVQPVPKQNLVESAHTKQLAQPQDVLEPEMLSLISVFKHYVTGILVVAILCGALLQVGLAQLWSTKVFPQPKIIDEFHHVRLSPMLGAVFIVTIILSYLQVNIALDVLPILYVVFFVSGISLLHYLCAKFKGLAWLGLFVFYSILSCIWMSYHSPLLFELVALFSLLDILVNWREKLNKLL